MHKSYQDVIDSAVVYGVPLDLTYEDYISNYLPVNWSAAPRPA